MIKRIHRYVLKSYIGPLIITFIISIFLLLMQFLWKYIDDLVGKGLEWHIIAELLTYASVSLVPMGLPLAILLASLMTFGNLGERYELFAIKSSGISLVNIMKPLIILNIFIAVGAFYFSNNLLPYSNLKMRTLLHDVQNQRPEISLSDGIFTNSIEGFSIKVDKKDKDNNLLHNILIYDHRKQNGNQIVTTAETGLMKMTSEKSHLILTLHNGHRYEAITDRKMQADFPYQITDFDKQTIYIPLDGLNLNRSDENLYKDHFQMLNVQQLAHAQDSLEYSLQQRRKAIGTSLMKYNQFKGLRKRKYNPESNLVFHKKVVKKPDKSGRLRETETISKDSTPNTGKNSNEDSTKKEKPPALETGFPFLSMDTVIPSELHIINVDSLLDSLPLMKQNRIIEFASNFVRSAKSYTDMVQREVEGNQRWINRHAVEWHKKYVLSVSILVLFLIGAPLGAIIRKGGFGMPVVVSVFLFIIYFVISITAEKMVRESVLPPIVGMWISTGILTPIGIFLTIKAANDSMMVRRESYERFMRRLMVRRRKHRLRKAKR